MPSYFYRDVKNDDVLLNYGDTQSYVPDRAPDENRVINTLSEASVKSDGKIRHTVKLPTKAKTTLLLPDTESLFNLQDHDASIETEAYKTEDINDDGTILHMKFQDSEASTTVGRGGYLAPRGVGQPSPSRRAAPPLMFGQHQYLPLGDDGTVHQLHPCPPPSPNSGDGGSNVFAFLTFGVVTVNVLMNAVANVNNNNQNNNNNDNNNNNNINNENISNNLDSNMNDNTISTGRSLQNCVCRGRQRDTAKDTPTEPIKTIRRREHSLTLAAKDRRAGRRERPGKRHQGSRE